LKHVVSRRTPKPNRGISKPLGSLIVDVMVDAILEMRRMRCAGIMSSGRNWRTSSWRRDIPWIPSLSLTLYPFPILLIWLF